MTTLLEELTKNFPQSIKLNLRVAMDQTRIRNPNDPIYELMVVLGVWAAYYETIPGKIRDVEKSVMQSLDSRIELLQKHARTVQTAVDRMDSLPSQIVDQFPSDTLAASIAKKIDGHFQSLPLTKLERDLKSLENSMRELTGTQGLTKRVEDTMEDLKKTVKAMADRGFAEDRLPRDTFILIFAGLVLGALIGVMMMHIR